MTSSSSNMDTGETSDFTAEYQEVDSGVSSTTSLNGVPSESSNWAMKFTQPRVQTVNSSSSSDGDSVDNEEPYKKVANTLTEDSFLMAKAVEAPRGRVACLKEEENCSTNKDAAFEKVVQASHQVSSAFDGFGLAQGFKKPITTGRINSLRIVTNAFIPRSCSPSPTRFSPRKQCYSPSTQQIVKPNDYYSARTDQTPFKSPSMDFELTESGSPSLLTPRKRKMLDFEEASPTKRANSRENCYFKYPTLDKSIDDELMISERTTHQLSRGKVSEDDDFNNNTDHIASTSMINKKSGNNTSADEDEPMD